MAMIGRRTTSESAIALWRAEAIPEDKARLGMPVRGLSPTSTGLVDALGGVGRRRRRPTPRRGTAGREPGETPAAVMILSKLDARPQRRSESS